MTPCLILLVICVIRCSLVDAYSSLARFSLISGTKSIAQIVTTPKSMGNKRPRSSSSIELCRDRDVKRQVVLRAKHDDSIRATTPIFTINSSNAQQETITRRREFIKASIAITTTLSSHPPSAKALSLPFASKPSRRQLELCLVGVLRLRYWAQNVGSSIIEMRRSTNPALLTEAMKGPYLEARLGAKAALTGRIGGGSNSNVITIGSLQIRECLKDGTFWYDEYVYKNLKNESKEQKAVLMKQRVALLAASEDITESLAAVVEFDGLENLQDASPRSSLALSMYGDSKANFIQRMLLERTVVNCDVFVNCFGKEERDVCERYIKVNYPNEMPRVKIIEQLT